MLAGLVLKSRPFARLRPAVVTEVHKTLALTGLGALVLHAVALVLDSTVKVSLAALVVPGLVSYRPAAVAAGVVAGWLFALVTGSFWLRKRIGTRVWRRLHWATYALFVLATVHGITAGTDTTQPWAYGLYVDGPRRRHHRDRVARSCSTHPTSHTERSHSMSRYIVKIDAAECIGYGQCVNIAPELFELEAGVARVVVTETSDPAALDAAAECPMSAILVEEAAQAA